MNAVSDPRGVAHVLHAVEENREVVAAHARDRVDPTNAPLEPAGHLDQHAVPRVAPVRAVQLPELVQIDHQHREQVRVPARRPPRHLTQPLEKERPVGQPGERIVQRVPGEVGLVAVVREGAPNMALRDGESDVDLVAQRGLGQEVAGARVESLSQMGAAFHPGHEQDVNIFRVGGGAQPPAELHPVHARELPVQDDQEVTLALERAPGGLGIRHRVDPMAAYVEDGLDQAARGRLVLDDQHPEGFVGQGRIAARTQPTSASTFSSMFALL